jgi:hypothetical protein
MSGTLSGMKTVPAEREIQIGQRLRAFREMKRIPRTAFAVSIQIGSERLASYEVGRVPLRYGVFKAIVREYAIHPVWLASGDGSPVLPEPADASRFIISDISDRLKFSYVYDQMLKLLFREQYTSVEWYLRRIYNSLADFQERVKTKPETMNKKLWTLLMQTFIAVRQNVQPSQAECRKARAEGKAAMKALTNTTPAAKARTRQRREQSAV